MALRDDVIAAAQGILADASAGLTGEALAHEIARRVGRQMPPAQVATLLRGLPQQFIEGADGRWRLRARPGVLTAEEEVPAEDTQSQPPPARPPLQRGCYVACGH